MYSNIQTLVMSSCWGGRGVMNQLMTNSWTWRKDLELISEVIDLHFRKNGSISICHTSCMLLYVETRFTTKAAMEKQKIIKYEPGMSVSLPLTWYTPAFQNNFNISLWTPLSLFSAFIHAHNGILELSNTCYESNSPHKSLNRIGWWLSLDKVDRVDWAGRDTVCGFLLIFHSFIHHWPTCPVSDSLGGHTECIGQILVK